MLADPDKNRYGDELRDDTERNHSGQREIYRTPTASCQD